MSSSTTPENQYLRPDDLPITDAKKNPLALLAMTCSNIGADILGTGKPIVNFERSNKKSSSNHHKYHNSVDDSRSDSVSSDKVPSTSVDSNRSNSRSSSDGHRSNSINGSSSSSNSQKISFKPYEDIQHRQNGSNHKNLTNDSSHHHHHHRDSDSKESKSSPSKNSSPPITHKSSACRDPYFTSCPSSTTNGLSSLTPCCHAFPHCIHATSSFATSFPPPPPPSATHPSSAFASAAYASSAAAAAAAAALAMSSRFHSSMNGTSQSPTSTKPFMCHWTGGGMYCGKSFVSCEELLQHLKTHTLSPSSPSNSSSSSLYPHPSLSSPYHPFGGFTRSPSVADTLRYHPYSKSSNHSAFGSHLRSPPSTSLFGPSPHHPFGVTHPSALAAAAAAASGTSPTHHHGSPSMTIFHPSQHPSLGSFYTLLN